MDIYTRHLLVKPRQEDLLREASEARLAREVRRASRSAPQRSFIGRIEALAVRPLGALHAQRERPSAEKAAGRQAPVLHRAGLRG